jgi:uncharacterized membrane protein
MKKIIGGLLLILIFFYICPQKSSAEGSDFKAEEIIATSTGSAIIADKNIPEEYTFKAEVVKVSEERTVKREDGSSDVQQNLLLRGLNGRFKNQEITSIGIGDFDVVSVGTYQEGDHVYVDLIANKNGQNVFFVTDYDRTGWLYLLVFIFIAITIMIGGRKGFRSLLALLLSFAVIIFWMVPWLLKGFNPLLIAVFGALLVMAIIIYLTDGFNRKSHLAVLTVFISLILTLLFALVFTWLTKLSGFSSEEATLLIGTSAGKINFQDLLLAGILIGAVGVLDDIILGQIQAVEEIKLANPNLTVSEVFRSANRVGQTHLGAIINTLFLTYVGVALPLLILFYVSPDGSKTDFFQIINNDAIATEIVRTLVGSIGLMLSMPIATYLASRFLKKS